MRGIYRIYARAGELKDDIEGMDSVQLNKFVNKAAMKKIREERMEGKKLGRLLRTGYEKRIP